jgi:YgiT-type zinc finger domain-containing protein
VKRIETAMTMIGHPCTLRGCGGTYQDRTTTRVEDVGGRRVLIDGIPAEVCDRCGDTLFSLEAVRGMEEARRRAAAAPPDASVPVYRFRPAPAA